MLERHTVFSIIRALFEVTLPYQHATPPGEKCGLARRGKDREAAARDDVALSL